MRVNRFAVLWMLTPAFAASRAQVDPSVFQEPPAAMTERIHAATPAAGEPLRTLVVEERVGSARRGRLVRVPLFFHEGECADPNALTLAEQTASGPGRPIPYQVDDVRRDASGQVSRMHLYFEADLEPWQRRRYVLMRGKNPALPAMKIEQGKGWARLGGEGLQVTFVTAGARAGSISAIATPLGRVRVGAAGLAPRLTLVRQSNDLKIVRSSPISYADPKTFEVRDLRYAAGPLFSKLVVRIGPPGLPDNATFVYLVPRKGSEFIQQEILSPNDANDTDVVGAKENVLLTGEMALGDGDAIAEVPAGLRRLTRSVIEEKNQALVDAKAGISFFPVPYVQTGVEGVDAKDGVVSVLGTHNFLRTAAAASDSLRQFWTETRYVFTRATDTEALWEVSKAHFQPLTAVVDEPGLTAHDLHQELSRLMPQFRRLSWGQEAAKMYTEDRDADLKRALAASPPLVEGTLVAQAHAAYEKKMADNKGAPLRQDQITSAAGPLDSYGITQSMSPYAFLADAGFGVKELTADALAVSRASRTINGKVNEFGFPFINEFYTAFNMQGGSIILGLYAGAKTGDPVLMQYYRDVARSSAVLDIYGHGQRSYPGNPAPPGNSDMLYECVSDFWVRNAALVSGEDLWQHPAVFGRFLDAIDVNADLYDHPVGGYKKVEYPASGRANVFRTQNHDHRWGYWIAAPYLGVLAHPEDGGAVGISESIYWARTSQNEYLNWPDATILFLADIDQRLLLRSYTAPKEPALPANVRTEHGADGNTVRWTPSTSADVIGYRVYRSDFVGGPITFVNSPYWPVPGKLATGDRYVDPDGKAGQVYFVTAVDKDLRESRWFPDEPRK